MLQPVRGTTDLLPPQWRRHAHVTETARQIVERYGYETLDTPIFEYAPVFQSIGETSDIITKETYTFEDRGGKLLTLRPEGTASVVRAIISNGLTQQLPLKFFYAGPMFRYERPQKGRYRQFHQFGVELFGVEQPLGDAEIIAMAQQVLDALDLEGNISLEINTLGDLESRLAYLKAFTVYLSDFKDQLSEDSQRRLQKNPLRVLDSKDPHDIQIVEKAPLYRDYLNAESEDFFASVLKQLDFLGVKYQINNRIVRGLDYYSHTTFEFVSDGLGAQSTVLAGGRYNRLVEMMGGPEIPGIGWAAGVERLAMLAKGAFHPLRPIAVVPIGDVAEMKALELAQRLRHQGFKVVMGYAGALKKRLKQANKQQARYALLIGEEELESDKIQVRDLDSGEQRKIADDRIVEYLQQQ